MIYKLVFLLLLSGGIGIGLGSPEESHSQSPRQGRLDATRTNRRPSLHELLQKNRNVASADEQLSLGESVTDNNDRKIIISQRSRTAPSVPGNIRQGSNALKRDVVTKYRSPFSSSNAPSYADPELLNAVMQQADEANYRFPDHISFTSNEETSEPLSSGSSIRRSIDSVPEENDFYPSENVNPYDLFPPAFHELLDIPMHVPQHSMNEEKPQKGPIITRGYASTNVNGHSSQEPKTTVKPQIVRPVQRRNRPRTQPNYKPAIRRPTRYTTTPRTTTTSSTTTTTTISTTTDQVQYNKKPSYIENRKTNFDRLPSVDHEKLSTPKIIRPRLRLRTTTEKPITSPTPRIQKIKIEPMIKATERDFDKIVKNKSKNYYETAPKNDDETFDLPHNGFITSSEKEEIRRFFGEHATVVTPPPTFNKKKYSQISTEDSSETSSVRPPFKPSKIDPFIGKFSSPQPTTYKPEFFSYGNQFNAVPSNNFVNNQGYNAPSITSYGNLKSSNSMSIRERDYLHEQEQSSSPFIRHPSVDRHTFQKIRPFRRHPSEFSVPSYLENKEEQAYSNQSPEQTYADTFMQSPPRHVLAPEENYYQEPPTYRRSSNSHKQKRPSILGSFGFFPGARPVNRRKGISSAKVNNQDKKHLKSGKESGYVLTQGPLPTNARRVRVIGPFKHPPIGAPVVRPHQAPVQGNSILPTEPSTILIPPSQFEHPSPKSVEVVTRGPSFKVINLPKEEGEIQTNEITNTFLPPQPLIHDNPFPFKQSFHTKRSSYDASKEKYNTYRNPYEVSEHDKKRLIAAKFHFPRVESVRRSGPQRPRMIPVPVPLLTESGNQISHFKTLVLPDFQPQPRRFYQSRSSKSHHEIKSPISAVQQPPTKNVVHQSKSIQADRIVYPQPRSLKTDEPQSFREPSVSGLNYGGWKVIGKSQINVDPIVSYVRENVPDLTSRN